MKVDGCPDRETLERHLLGKLSKPEHDRVGEHLLRCDQCATAASTIGAADGVTEAVLSRPVRSDDGRTLVEARDRANQIHSQSETATTGETITFDQGQAAHEHEYDMSTVPAHVDFLNPPQQPDEIGRLGNYRVLEVIGVGGMGLVFRGEDPNLKRLVALKAMKPAIAAGKAAKDRFLQEAQATAAIEHHNIVHIYEVGEDRGIPFIAMQFLRGESLQKRLEREAQLDQRDVIRIGREVADGLAAAHDRGLIHRDIKPDNIWLEQNSGWAKILDFGLARSHEQDAGLTQTGVIVGTPKYMSPEQAKGELVDSRSDLFSLGSVLYHLASGKPPFGGGNLTATLIAVTQADCQAIEKACPELHSELAKLIMRLLSKDPAQRPQSAGEVAAALAEIERNLNDQQASQAEQVQPAETTGLSQPDLPAIKRILGKPVFLGSLAVASMLATFIVLWASGILFRVETDVGTIRVEINGAGQPIEVNVSEDKTVEIEDPNDGKLIKVTVDREKQQLILEKQGFKLATKSFSLESRDGRTVKVTFEPIERAVGKRDPALVPFDDLYRGWHGRSADAPPPATAPFDSEQARQHQRAWADYVSMRVERDIELPGGEKLTMVLIPPGEFLMGSTEQEQQQFMEDAKAVHDLWSISRIPNEGPQHRVRINRPFYLGKYEVTQAQWQSVMKDNPSSFRYPSGPVEQLGWDDIQPFLSKLNEASKHRGVTFALPTEAQWEFACRAGTTTFWHSGNDQAALYGYAWLPENSELKTHPVGQLLPNHFGLYDMHGNVWEWCNDWYEPDYYSRSAADDPQGPETGSRRVFRGGSWKRQARLHRSAYRYDFPPEEGSDTLGFRLALVLTEQ